MNNVFTQKKMVKNLGQPPQETWVHIKYDFMWLVSYMSSYYKEESINKSKMEVKQL
jgi:hypothetical protein